jgi:hypothetical protein
LSYILVLVIEVRARRKILPRGRACPKASKAARRGKRAAGVAVRQFCRIVREWMQFCQECCRMATP